MDREIAEIKPSYGEKLISLFVELLFYNKQNGYSLPELARRFKCSKQTILRLKDDIERSFGIEYEYLDDTTDKRQKRFRLKSSQQLHHPKTPGLTEMDVNIMEMCHIFTRNILGDKLFGEATNAFFKSKVLFPEGMEAPPGHFASYSLGTIDHTPHHATMHTIIQAIDKKCVCRVSYQGLDDKKPEVYYIKPFKLFARKDSIYLHSRMTNEPGKRYRESDDYTVLAIHRIKEIEITDKHFSPPTKYDFEKAFNKTFGIIKNKPFKVEIELSGWAATRAAEKIWSQDQKITKLKGDRILLTFTATSEKEILEQLLIFGSQAKLLKPKALVAAMNEIVKNMYNVYFGDM
jgi:predicted DNA-binding transcriptional regulator YafY